MKIFNWGISRERSGLKEIERIIREVTGKMSDSCVRSTRMSVTQKKVKFPPVSMERCTKMRNTYMHAKSFSRVCLCVVYRLQPAKSSVHGSSLAWEYCIRLLLLSSRRSSPPRDWTLSLILLHWQAGSLQELLHLGSSMDSLLRTSVTMVELVSPREVDKSKVEWTVLTVQSERVPSINLGGNREKNRRWEESGLEAGGCCENGGGCMQGLIRGEGWTKDRRQNEWNCWRE